MNLLDNVVERCVSNEKWNSYRRRIDLYYHIEVLCYIILGYWHIDAEHRNMRHFIEVIKSLVNINRIFSVDIAIETVLKYLERMGFCYHI